MKTDATTAMKRLSEDDRDVLILRLVMPEINRLQHGQFDTLSVLLNDHPGYARMTDPELIREATARNVSLEGIETAAVPTSSTTQEHAMRRFLRTLMSPLSFDTAQLP